MVTGTHGSAWTLAIEISNPSSAGSGGTGPAVAGRLRDSEETFVEPLRSGDRRDDDLMPAIERLALRMGASPASLRRVVVSTGPGGYTALRVACVTARALARASGAEVVGVPTAEVVAAASRPGPRPMAVALATKGDSAHITLFKAEETTGEDLGVLSTEVFSELGAKYLLMDRQISNDFVERVANLMSDQEFPVFDARILLALGEKRPSVPVCSLEPFYAREPEAVRLWRHRQRGSRAL